MKRWRTRDRSRPQSYGRLVWKRLRRDVMAVSGLALVLVLFVISFLAPLLANNSPIYLHYRGESYFPAVRELFPISFFLKPHQKFLNADFKELVRDEVDAQALFPPIPYGPYEQNLKKILSPPGREHWMGTDDLGRDVASRMIHGAGISLKVGFVAMGIALVIGLVIGSAAGYYGGIADIVLSRLIEVVMCFPVLFLILAVLAFLPPSIYVLMAVIGATRWTSIARYVRGEILRLKEQEFTLAARAAGARDRRIILRHILPNALAPVLVAVTFGVAGAILTEAALSFLGLGVQPPVASWGGILKLSRQYLAAGWWLATFPGLAIFVTVTGYNLLGEGIRDASDPRLSNPKN